MVVETSCQKEQSASSWESDSSTARQRKAIVSKEFPDSQKLGVTFCILMGNHF